eukprot:Em0011g798a
MLMWFLAFLVTLVIICGTISSGRTFGFFFSRNATTNPFKIASSTDGSKRAKSETRCQARRDEVLKESLAEDKVPPQLDAIVIGSGIGGLAAAALLAKAGKKVLVLEQHDQAGGCCHTFVDKGVLVDEISNGGIEWVKLEHVLDTVVIGDSANQVKYPVGSGQDEFKNMLIGQFPSDKEAIVQFFALVDRLKSVAFGYVVLKLLPLWFSRFLIRSGLAVKIFPPLAYSTRTVAEVLDELTPNEELKSVITYLLETMVRPPAKLPDTTTACSSITSKRVVEILVDEGGRAVGVRAKKGHLSYEITAPPRHIRRRHLQTQSTSSRNPKLRGAGSQTLAPNSNTGWATFSMFVGLEGTAAELGLKAENFWVFQDKNTEKAFSAFVGQPYQEAMKQPVPLMFVSFPSAKDPTFNNRYPGKSTCTIITVTPYEWFQEWAEQRVTHRDDDYKSVKETIAEQMWRQVLQLFPNLEGRRVYCEVGTPLSNCYYLNAPRGEIYGADHNTARFGLEAVAEMRPGTDVPGLYLTGQDVLTCGFSGALFGGVLCASEVLGRNIMGDLMAARKRMRKKQD